MEGQIATSDSRVTGERHGFGWPGSQHRPFPLSPRITWSAAYTNGHMAWECDRCGQVHTQNPAECRSCGHRVLAPVSDAELRSRSEERDSPEPLEMDTRSLGAPSDEDLPSGPDTAPDGSLIASDDSAERTTEEPGASDRFGWRLSSRLEVYSTRPTAIIIDTIRVLVLAAILLAVWFVAAPYL